MSVPILTYHAVEMNGGEYKQLPPNKVLYLIKRDLFEAQIRYLAEQNFRTALVEDLISVAHTQGSLSERTVCLTFDDGSASDYRIVFPVLRKYGLRANFFVVTDRVGKPGYVTWNQLNEMTADGMSVQSHSHTHPFFSQCTASEIRKELVQSKSIIETHLGGSVKIFAVPGGDWNERCRSAVKDCGYQAVCTSRAGINRDPLDLLALKRLSIRRADSLAKFVSFVTLDARALFANSLKTTLLNLARRSMGLDKYNLVRAFLLQGRKYK
ncbi:MAG: polysaccharide deacetylase family protein [Candidatus Binatia bacterium]